MKKVFYFLWLLTITTGFAFSIKAQMKDEKQFAIANTKKIIDEIAIRSFPEIKLKKIRIKTFESDKNFFKARFSFTRFLTFQKMQHIISVNPKVYSQNAPVKGLRSVIAHELAHVLYYTEKNRLELLGLISLASGDFTSKFERKADLEAIKRGYGEGLIVYREWLYEQLQNNEIKSKKKDYFTPDEIKLMLEITKDKPEMFNVWRKDIPKNIYEIKKSIE